MPKAAKYAKTGKAVSNGPKGTASQRAIGSTNRGMATMTSKKVGKAKFPKHGS